MRLAEAHYSPMVVEHVMSGEEGQTFYNRGRKVECVGVESGVLYLCMCHIKVIKVTAQGQGQTSCYS